MYYINKLIGNLKDLRLLCLYITHINVKRIITIRTLDFAALLIAFIVLLWRRLSVEELT